MMTYLDDLQSQTARGDELAAAVEGLELERAALAAEVERLRGAIAAQDDRDRAAAEMAGETFFGCDTSDHLADVILELRAQLAAVLGAKIEVVPAPMRLRDDETPETTEERVRELENALDDAQLLADERGEELARGAGEGWRAVTVDWPPSSQSLPVLLRNGSARWGYRANGLWHLTGGKFAADAVTHAYVMRPAPPQE